MSEKQSKMMRKMWSSLLQDEKQKILSEMGRISVKVRLGKLSKKERSKFMSNIRNLGILRNKLKEKKEYELANGTNNESKE